MAKFIQQSYLMWVGAEHYPNIESYVAEATKLGISKRMPTPAMAMALNKPGTVVFLAHDEGQHTECPACTAKNICWNCDGIGKINVGTSLEDGCAHCDNGIRVGGTGGTLTVDGEQMPWIAHWRAKMYDKTYRDAVHVITDEAMCKGCGGKGAIPAGVVFGAFVPQDIEYIVPTGATEEVRELAAKRGFKMVEQVAVATEVRRGCGMRKVGGVYVVTKDKELDPAVQKQLTKELVETGKMKAGATVHGSFLQFLEPIVIAERRFRGMKRWELTADVEAGAEMMLEATAS